MSEFAKLFNSDPFGQILVTLETDDGCVPAVITKAQPKGLGVCAVRLSFEDSEAGWDKAEAAFSAVDLNFAETCARKIFGAVGQEQTNG